MNCFKLLVPAVLMFSSYSRAEICSTSEYLQKRPDVQRAAVQQRKNPHDFAIFHYQHAGKFEGMCEPRKNYQPRSSEKCSPEEYLNRRPDVRAAARSNRRMSEVDFAIAHYRNFGINEGMCEPVKGYRDVFDHDRRGGGGFGGRGGSSSSQEVKVSVNQSFYNFGGFNLGAALRGKNFGVIQSITVVAKSLNGDGIVSLIDTVTGNSQTNIHIPGTSHGGFQSNASDTYFDVKIQGLNIPNRVNLAINLLFARDSIKVKEIIINKSSSSGGRGSGDGGRGGNGGRGNGGGSTPAAMCGAYSIGQKWFVQEGTMEVKSSCPGTSVKKVELFNKEVEKVCQSSGRNSAEPQATGNSRKGEFVRIVKACPKINRKCGNKNHGETWFEVNGEVKEQVQCRRASSQDVFTIFEKKVEYKCNDGSKQLTGTSEKGAELRTEGSCGGGRGDRGGRDGGDRGGRGDRGDRGGDNGDNGGRGGRGSGGRDGGNRDGGGRTGGDRGGRRGNS